MSKIFAEPWAPARAAVQALVGPRKAGHAPSEAQVLVEHIITSLDQLAAEGRAATASESDALRAHIERAVELVCPLVTDQEADERRQQAERRVFVEEAFRLACGHLSL